MNHYWWCSICERTAVNREGDDTCVRCAAAIEAICYPSDRIDGVWRRKPWGVRFIDWIGERWTA